AYTARSPVEGKLLALNEINEGSAPLTRGGLWVRTDEDDDVVLTFGGMKWLWPPRALVRYGERVGQGQRCAFLRLARTAEIYLPLRSRLRVTPGVSVHAGSSLIAELVHK
ncbi:MAG: phosphatidylserine decarboxylase, partial [Gammaproteobacteria bacterium]|nr:phosphatidylserine decarboxylase [Gammaproteobacteria bacterium]